VTGPLARKTKRFATVRLGGQLTKGKCRAISAAEPRGWGADFASAFLAQIRGDGYRASDGCTSVVTVTIGEAQSSQTGAGNLRVIQVSGSKDMLDKHATLPAEHTLGNAKAWPLVP
jgi:hypothetical protein